MCPANRYFTRLDNEVVILNAEVERLKLVVGALLPYVEAHTDAGPVGEGWKSDELVMALNAARAVLGREKF